jgi:hypothetical protein
LVVRPGVGDLKEHPFAKGLSRHSLDLARAVPLAIAAGGPNKRPMMITAKTAENLEAVLNMIFIPHVNEEGAHKYREAPCVR